MDSYILAPLSRTPCPPRLRYCPVTGRKGNRATSHPSAAAASLLHGLLRTYYHPPWSAVVVKYQITTDRAITETRQWRHGQTSSQWSVMTHLWHSGNLSLFCLKLDTRRPQYDNGPARADTSRPGPAQSDDILARTRPGPLKFVNFWPKPGPYGPCRAGSTGRPARAGFYPTSAIHESKVKYYARGCQVNLELAQAT